MLSSADADVIQCVLLLSTIAAASLGEMPSVRQSSVISPFAPAFMPSRRIRSVSLLIILPRVESNLTYNKAFVLTVKDLRA